MKLVDPTIAQLLSFIFNVQADLERLKAENEQLRRTLERLRVVDQPAPIPEPVETPA
jgi:hypothetical protein